ncbi:hypothetical protein Cob_v012629 [Colletotrichum orbiculare MAFF 240422]|uniref:Uncharacterized protein n=1 Tax=Colletotrichum orbiculare (strain 104-T / ATCC 96160 / CBS 514.97 / LARS 414 / MAFF 240422) TaxID=1213857 RepID=A0A484F971_COLOR|nr:hypothetical protein Cob_v012629 [Colletotrichum orbiculare MAFF 240422]
MLLSVTVAPDQRRDRAAKARSHPRKAVASSLYSVTLHTSAVSRLSSLVSLVSGLWCLSLASGLYNGWYRDDDDERDSDDVLSCENVTEFGADQ